MLSSLYGIHVDNGNIDLDATLEELNIDDISPGLTDAEKQATVRDLISSRSGVYHVAAAEWAGVGSDRRNGEPLPLPVEFLPPGCYLAGLIGLHGREAQHVRQEKTNDGKQSKVHGVLLVTILTTSREQPTAGTMPLQASGWWWFFNPEIVLSLNSRRQTCLRTCPEVVDLRLLISKRATGSA